MTGYWGKGNIFTENRGMLQNKEKERGENHVGFDFSRVTNEESTEVLSWERVQLKRVIKKKNPKSYSFYKCLKTNKAVATLFKGPPTTPCLSMPGETVLELELEF